MDLQVILAVITKWAPLACEIIAICAAIAALTPSKSDDRIIQFILDIINKLGLNVGKATNKDD